MSYFNATPMPPSDSNPAVFNGDVMRQLIELGRREIELSASTLADAISRNDRESATQLILQIQACALLHGLDDIAVLATEAEHAVELNDESSPSWTIVAKRLVDQCRPDTRQPGQAA